jgi:hypothetical protein
MIPIAEYGASYRAMTEEQFCKQYPHPVLVFCAETSNPLKPLDATRGLTIDRLVLDSGEQDDGFVPGLRHAYTVFPLQPKQAGVPRVAIGCSHTCDVQVNDSSVSRVHAILERKGDEYELFDNGSASGTQVNGEVLVLNQGVSLQPGDRVTLGFVDFLFLQPRDFYRLLAGIFPK